jgi:soluble lytic murein transglycosylase-like protein
VIGGLLLILWGAMWLVAGCTAQRMGLKLPRWREWTPYFLLLAGVVIIWLGASSAHAQTVRIPDVSARLRLQVEQASAEEWGVDSSPARLAAQLHQESVWNANAKSPAGAEGLAQFMPATGRWLSAKFPQLGPYDPWDPAWSARAAAVYDHWLLTRNPGRGACSNWAFALSAYNGGESMLRREQALAKANGRDQLRWFGNTADYRVRSASAFQENRAYVKRILLTLEPAYVSAGWAGKAVCT